MGDILIRGGTVIDGTGAPGRIGDVRVREGLVIEVGPELESQGEPEIDARGAVVAPGFIENHTHVDPALFWDPFCDPTPQHGVTTVLAGNCSLSLFPLNDEIRDEAVALFCLIEDMPPAAFELGVPFSWTDYAGYRDVLAKDGLGVNAATLLGHTLLRWVVMGDAAWERVATADEVAKMCEILEESLQAGAFGLSTSFSDQDHRGQWVPPRFADDAEFEALFDVLAKNGGIVEFVPNLSGSPEEDIERMARLTGPRGVISTWNTLAQTKRAPGRAQRFLDQATRLQESGVKIYPQGTPRPFDLRIGWDRSVMFNDMPTSWAHVIRADHEGKRALLTDPAWREVGRTEWDAAKQSIFPTWDISRLRLISVTRPENERWVGSTLADLVAERGGHPSDVLADWLLQNDFDPGVVASGVSNDEVDEVGEILCNPATLIGGSDNGAHVAMFCAAGDSTLLLTRYVRERGDMTLEAGIHELSGKQAVSLGFGGRGIIAPGNHGDLVVFALDELKWEQDSFVADLPGGGSRLRRPEGGYRHTIIAGEIVLSGGVLTGARPGRPIGFAEAQG